MSGMIEETDDDSVPEKASEPVGMITRRKAKKE